MCQQFDSKILGIIGQIQQELSILKASVSAIKASQSSPARDVWSDNTSIMSTSASSTQDSMGRSEFSLTVPQPSMGVKGQGKRVRD